MRAARPSRPARRPSPRFSAVVRLRHRGLYRALIKVSNDGAHVSNYSEPVLIR